MLPPPVRVTPRQGRPLLPVYVLATMILLFWMSWLLPQSRRRYARVSLLLATPVLLLAACNGGSTLNASSGTPAGTYNVVLTGSAGTMSHSAPVTLTVK